MYDSPVPGRSRPLNTLTPHMSPRLTKLVQRPRLAFLLKVTDSYSGSSSSACTPLG